MPIHVTIAVNEREVEHLHIARLTGSGRAPNVVHTYAVLRQREAPTTDQAWASGIFFKHQYGDDITRLVERAIKALHDIPTKDLGRS